MNNDATLRDEDAAKRPASRVGTSESSRSGASLGVVLAFGFVPFAAVILFAATQMPMSYDDAFNATLPLNLLRGNGYSSHVGRIKPFDLAISSGATYLAPAALPMAVLGTSMQSPMLYAAAICLILYLCLLRSLHGHAPQAALATAVLVPFTLWHGKNDIVADGNVLPEPIFGYWYQLLGNLPGVLGLALAMSLLLDRSPTRNKRQIAIVVLTVFAVNAKVMHLIPLIAMVATWAVLPSESSRATPAATTSRVRRIAIALGLIAAGWCGLRLNRTLAWIVLDSGAFEHFVAGETKLMGTMSGVTALTSVHLATVPRVLARALANLAPARDFLGGSVPAGALLAGLIATAVAASKSARRSSIARLALVFLAGAAAHLAWWVCLPVAQARHLTPVPGLACFAMGCGFGLWWDDLHSASAYPRRRAAWCAALAFLCAAGTPRLLAATRTWTELREHREQQLTAAALLERLAVKYPDAAFCGPGWWLPRELTYLASENVRFCNLDAVRSDASGRRVLMRATNIWPLQWDGVRSAEERCPTLIGQTGRFEFRGCDGFRP